MLKIALAVATLIAAPALAQQAAAPQPQPQPQPAKAPKYERIVCRTMMETGSLIKKHKTCKSLAAWDREADAVRANGVSDSCSKRGEGGICS